MRRWFGTIILTVSVTGTLMLAGPAAANGGAYFEVSKTFNVSGETASAEYYVDIPERKVGLLEQGPFYGYLLPPGADLKEGRPTPPDAVRVGTFAVTKEKGQYEFALSFTTPALATGDYSLQLCNDPCTISGFAEPVTGFLTIVATPFEARLLKEQQVSAAKLNRAKRELRRTGEALKETTASLEEAIRSGSAAAATTQDLRSELEALAAAPPPRPIVETWAAVLVAIVLALLVIVSFRRRSARSDAETAPQGVERAG